MVESQKKEPLNQQMAQHIARIGLTKKILERNGAASYYQPIAEKVGLQYRVTSAYVSFNIDAQPQLCHIGISFYSMKSIEQSKKLGAKEMRSDSNSGKERTVMNQLFCIVSEDL
jgi:hypothetical protein